MIPIALDPTMVPLAVIGRGDPALRRFRLLLSGGAREVTLFCDTPTPALEAAAGPRLQRRLPDRDAIAPYRVVWIAGLPEVLAADLARTVRDVGALANVEDVKPFCDFHSVAEVRRGDLLLTVSTGGQSPGLAAQIRRHLERSIDADWAQRVTVLGAWRAEWRARGLSASEVAQLTEAALEREGWLP